MNEPSEAEHSDSNNEGTTIGESEITFEAPTASDTKGEYGRDEPYTLSFYKQMNI